MPRHRSRPLMLVTLNHHGRPQGQVPLTTLNASTGPQPVICARVSDGPPAVPSRQSVCDGCLARIWLSPATEVLIPQLRASVVCWCCCGSGARPRPPGSGRTGP